MSDDPLNKGDYAEWEEGLHERLQDLPTRVAHIESTAKAVAQLKPELSTPSINDARYGNYLSAAAVKAACVLVAFPFTGKKDLREEECQEVATRLLYEYQAWVAGRN